jgi:hypothetical protein
MKGGGNTKFEWKQRSKQELLKDHLAMKTDISSLAKKYSSTITCNQQAMSRKLLFQN